jgi:hypothetical protein
MKKLGCWIGFAELEVVSDFIALARDCRSVPAAESRAKKR